MGAQVEPKGRGGVGVSGFLGGRRLVTCLGVPECWVVVVCCVLEEVL